MCNVLPPQNPKGLTGSRTTKVQPTYASRSSVVVVTSSPSPRCAFLADEVSSADINFVLFILSPFFC